MSKEINEQVKKTINEPKDRSNIRDEQVAEVRLPSGKHVSRSQYNSWYRFRAR
jgi:hypothetical protein